MSKSTFEKNGGYFIDGIAYMDCKITGEPVANVSTELNLLLVELYWVWLVYPKKPRKVSSQTTGCTS